jgi:hypothetical protein
VATLSRSDLVALARKYRTIAELRRAQHLASREQAIGMLRELAREFPGALRELDSLPLEEIERRLERIERAMFRGEAEQWMGFMHEYHRMLRAALGVKRRLGARKSVEELVALEIAREVTDESGFGCDVEFVQAVARPPRGRVSVFVLRRIAVAFGTEPESIARALFPEREQVSG